MHVAKRGPYLPHPESQSTGDLLSGEAPDLLSVLFCARSAQAVITIVSNSMSRRCGQDPGWKPSLTYSRQFSLARAAELPFV